MHPSFLSLLTVGVPGVHHYALLKPRAMYHGARAHSVLYYHVLGSIALNAHAQAPVGAAMSALCRNNMESSQDPGGAALSRLQAEEMEMEEVENVNTTGRVTRV